LSLIQSKSLAFPSALKLSEIDKYEGSFTKVDIDYDPAKDPVFQNTKAADFLKIILPKFRLQSKDERKGIYINSWYMNPHQSFAMWDIYSRAG